MDANTGLTAQVKTALGWRFGTLFSRIGLQLVVMMVLARLLSVADFGLFGQAMIVVGLVTVFAEIGMAPALIQKKRLSETQKQVAVTVSILTGVLFTVLIWSAAPLLSFVFKTDDAVPVLRGLSFAFLFTGLNATAAALLQRDLNFRSLFWVEFLSYLIGYSAVGIGLAFLGWGVWSIVVAVLTQEALRTVLIFAAAGRLPKLSFAFHDAQGLFKFGAGMSGTRLVLYFARNADYLLVGRFLGTHSLGLYTRSYQLMNMPLTRFSGVLNSVLFSAYSRVQADNDRLRPAFYQNVAAVAVVVFPLLACLAVMGEEVIHVMLGDKWHDAALPFQLLCLGGIPLCLHNICESVTRAKGSIRGRLWRHLIYLAIVSFNVAIGSQWGLPGVAIGVGCALLVQCSLMAHFALYLVDGTWTELTRSLRPGLLLAVAAAGLAAVTAGALSESITVPLFVLLATTSVVTLAYFGVMLIFTEQLLPPLLSQAIIGVKSRVAMRLLKRPTAETKPRSTPATIQKRAA